MGERDVIARTARPATAATIADDLRALGVGTGDVLVVHTSLSALGWVAGGAQAVLEALRSVVGEQGTLTMPSHSGDRSEPSNWGNPSVPAEWWPVIRAATPAYDERLTPLREMGAVAEALHRAEGTLRSAHPRLSHLANGPLADHVVTPHEPGAGLGDDSPLGRLVRADALVLLLGVGHANNTMLHLAEHRADWPGRRTIRQGSAVRVAGERQWVAYDELDLDADDFPEIGAAFEATGQVRIGRVGAGTARFMPSGRLVEFATDWIARHRCGPAEV